MLRLKTLIAIAYLIAGLIVAANDNYLRELESVRQVVSALLAIVLWPLVLLGVDLHIRG
jgi:ABC-type anion transport system duplicated permease subunit